MGLLLLFCAVLALFGLSWISDVLKYRHPLGLEEVRELASKRQWEHLLRAYAFSSAPRIADPSEKKAMKGSGQFVRCNLSYSEMPSVMSGLLKYKKHEWIVMVFIRNFHAEYLWWNKGSDGRSVSPRLSGGYLENAIKLHKPDTLAILHNHPNPNPSRYRANLPSAQDLRSAEYMASSLAKAGIGLIEFVCERGMPHMYYAFLNSDLSPLDDHIERINGLNGAGIFKNVELRRELARRTLVDHGIRGGVF
jgi:hypothetical protein